MANDTNLLNFFGAMIREHYQGNYAQMLWDFKCNHNGNVTAAWWDIYTLTEEDVLEYVLDDDEYKIYEALDRDTERVIDLLDSGKYIIIDSADPHEIGKSITNAMGSHIDEQLEEFVDYEKIAVHYEEMGNTMPMEDGNTLYVWDR